MENTTLVYVRHQAKILMLHRIKRESDLNAGKWIAVGGHFEEDESPDECARREVREESGLEVGRMTLRGIVTFCSDEWPCEYMHVFTCEAEDEKVIDCDEGVLAWIPEEEMEALPQWEGDRIFWQLLQKNAPFFLLKLVYHGDELTKAILNGVPMAKNNERRQEREGQ